MFIWLALKSYLLTGFFQKKNPNSTNITFQICSSYHLCQFGVFIDKYKLTLTILVASILPLKSVSSASGEEYYTGKSAVKVDITTKRIYQSSLTKKLWVLGGMLNNIKYFSFPKKDERFNRCELFKRCYTDQIWSICVNKSTSI